MRILRPLRGEKGMRIPISRIYHIIMQHGLHGRLAIYSGGD